MLQNANEAVAGIAGALANNFFLYPITPSTYASEIAAAFPGAFQMNSELGSIAAAHGAAHFTQEPAATFTSSQGLMLMLPSLYKMAGERVPAVVHVAARYVAGAALSIKCDHSDVALARNFAQVVMLSKDAREAEVDALAAYLLASRLQTPILHAYDGFLTSHEGLKFNSIRGRAKEIVDSYRKEFCGDRRPDARSVGFIADTDKTFELTEAQAIESRKTVPRIEEVQNFLKRHNIDFQLFRWYKQPENVRHIILYAGSAVDTTWKALEPHQDADCVQIKFLRPFIAEGLREVLKTYPYLETVTTMDRTRSLQPGAEPFAQEVKAALFGDPAFENIAVLLGVYGIGGREFTPDSCARVLENARGAKRGEFTVGITDDITGASLPPLATKAALDLSKAIEEGQTTAYYHKPLALNVFALGSEGCVTAVGALADALAGEEFKYAAFNSYFDAKKSNGLARAEIRLADDFLPPGTPGISAVADMRCFERHIYEIRARSAYKAPILVNCAADRVADVQTALPGKPIYVVDINYLAYGAAKTNFHFAYATACVLYREGNIKYKALNSVRYRLIDGAARFGADASTIQGQFEGIERTLQRIDSREMAVKSIGENNIPTYKPLSQFVNKHWMPHQTAWNSQRNIAREVPIWDRHKCIACGKCAVYCPHGAISAYLLDESEYKLYLEAHRGAKSDKHSTPLKMAGFYYVIQESPADCTGCEICAKHCPTGALKMTSNSKKVNAHEYVLYNLAYSILSYPGYAERAPATQGLSERELYFKSQTLKCHSACPGCGESNYIELLCKVVLETLKNPLKIVQGTGCPLVYLGEHGAQPFAAKDVFWTNSLFEDTAEVAFGLSAAYKGPVWAVMGDGAAYDIDFGGVDFVTRQQQKVKILILDNQYYANTGGQRSSATPMNVSAKLGRNTAYKDIGRILMQHENAYVATVSANDAARTARILKRAHEFDGPAVVIAYAPCSYHGSALTDAVGYSKAAVDSGMWVLYEYDPRADKGHRLKIQSYIIQSTAKMGERRIKNAELLDKELERRLKGYYALSESM